MFTLRGRSVAREPLQILQHENKAAGFRARAFLVEQALTWPKKNPLTAERRAGK
jgi:hypothetical protein